jgi:hypothetical protein
VPGPLKYFRFGTRNADLVVLKKPIHFPIVGAERRNIVQVALEQRSIGKDIGTTLRIGWKQDGIMYFDELLLWGDPFGLGRGECSS